MASPERLYEGAEPYELFGFGDELHLHDDMPTDEKTFYIGRALWKHAFTPTIGVTYAEYQLNQECEFALELRRGRIDIGWMPTDTPFWHRASHCPRKKEDR